MEGSVLLALTRVGMIGLVIVGEVQKLIHLDHVSRHVVCPFEHLWTNVIEEGIGRPSTHNHDFCGRVIHQEQGHRCPRANRLVTNFVRIKSEDILPTKDRASSSEQFENEGV